MKQILKLCSKCAAANSEYQGTNVYVPVTRRREWKMGKHLGQEVRDRIKRMRIEGCSLKRIAIELDLPYASLCRELKAPK